MKQLSETKSQIDNEILQLKSRLQTMEENENELRIEKRKMLREVRFFYQSNSIKLGYQTN